MILLIAVLAFLSAAFMLFRFMKRHDPHISAPVPVSIDPPKNARPLFEPTEADLRTERDRSEAKRIAQNEYHARMSAQAILDEALMNWRSDRNVRTAAELMRVASGNRLDTNFCRAANEIIDEFRANGINGLMAKDLASLLDSHSRLLPAGAQGSGELFWLRQEIARLNETEVS